MAVIGSGKIGIDLICKIRQSEMLNCVLVSGMSEVGYKGDFYWFFCKVKI